MAPVASFYAGSRLAVRVAKHVRRREKMLQQSGANGRSNAQVLRARRNMARAIVLAFAPALATPIVAPAGAINSTWTGGAGVWSTAAKWSPSGAPNNNVTNTFNVFIDGSKTGTISTVSMNIDPTIDNLTVDLNDSLTIVASHTLTLAPASGTSTITNNGTINIGGADP